VTGGYLGDRCSVTSRHNCMQAVSLLLLLLLLTKRCFIVF
jgi:hypothetical protein